MACVPVEANDAATMVQELAGEVANIIFGAVYDDSQADEATITVIATGLDPQASSMGKSEFDLKTPSFLKKSSGVGSNLSSDYSHNKNRSSKATNSQTAASKLSHTSNKKTDMNSSFDNADMGSIKIPEFLQKNRDKKKN